MKGKTKDPLCRSGLIIEASLLYRCPVCDNEETEFEPFANWDGVTKCPECGSDLDKLGGNR